MAGRTARITIGGQEYIGLDASEVDAWESVNSTFQVGDPIVIDGIPHIIRDIQISYQPQDTQEVKDE